MNKRMDDIFSQADKQLRDLESEIHDKESAQDPEPEVDRETAQQLQSAVGRELFAKRHANMMKFAGVAMALYLIAQIYMVATMPRATGPYHVVTGTVQSSSIVWSGRVHWGSVAASKVRLPDGRIVTIKINSGTLLPAGCHIALRVYDTGAIGLDQLL
jgi:hypothetical protein